MGLHASALAATPDGRFVVVANTGSDTLSVINTRTDGLVEKIWARQNPADLFGAQPDALAFGPGGRQLYVCNGTQNAVAVVQFIQLAGIQGHWLNPGRLVSRGCSVRRGEEGVYVANIKGLGAIKNFKPGEKVRLHTRDFFGAVSLVPLPSSKELSGLTDEALQGMRYPRLAEASLPARPGQPSRPVPERAGEPSPLKHVVYIIKENRGYDQVLGDMPEGNRPGRPLHLWRALHPQRA